VKLPGLDRVGYSELRFFEIALVLVHVDHIARVIVNADHGSYSGVG
jgi:hypothetical protein